MYCSPRLYSRFVWSSLPVLSDVCLGSGFVVVLLPSSIVISFDVVWFAPICDILSVSLLVLLGIYILNVLCILFDLFTYILYFLWFPGLVINVPWYYPCVALLRREWWSAVWPALFFCLSHTYRLWVCWPFLLHVFGSVSLLFHCVFWMPYLFLNLSKWLHEQFLYHLSSCLHFVDIFFQGFPIYGSIHAST